MKVIVSLNAKLSQRAKWYATHTSPLPLFKDVDQNAWYTPYIEAAYEKGIAKGYADGSFKPTQPLMSGEALALLMRIYGVTGSASPALTANAVENPAGQWYTPYINAGIEKNIFMDSVRFSPGQPITRGQFFDMVYRMHTITTQKIARFADGTEQEIVADSGVYDVYQNQQNTTVNASSRTTTTYSELTGRITGSQGSTTISGSRSNGTVTTGSRSNTITASSSRSSQPLTGTIRTASSTPSKNFAISMPSLGIENLVVTHPTDPFTKNGILAPLKSGVGHLFSYPGKGGKIMIYGHSSGYAWDVSKFTKIFRRVNELNKGDKIYVSYGGKTHEYEVTFEQAIKASDTTPFDDNGAGEELILYTCWPPDSISQRYLVHAKPVRSIATR